MIKEHETCKELSSELLANMKNNILPYWMDRMVDTGEGGFYGRRDGYDTLVPEAEKGAILNGRILWTFSAAYNATGCSRYLDMARRAYEYIKEHFIDSEYGGVYWSVNADGTPADTRKQFYAIAFVIYGLSEYSIALGGSEEVMTLAMELFDSIEQHSRDNDKVGYIEATRRDWTPIDDMRLSDKDANFSKTMNTHLHILEAYSALLRAGGDERVREATRYILRVFLDRIVDRSTWHLGLFFDDDWRRQDGIISYGHDIEASWLLLEAAMTVGEEDLIAETKDAARAVAEASMAGRCHDGSMVYERHADGRYDNEKHWWVQAEALVGQLYMYKMHGQQEYLDKAAQTWDYIRANLVDENGEWYWSILPDGSVNRKEDKAGFWKCPYHNSRACMESIKILAEN